MYDEYEVRRGEGETRFRYYPTLFESIKVAARLNVPVRGTNHINSTYAFKSYTLRMDLGFNPGIFGTETSY